MKIVAIGNSAGGVGKTTLSHCLAVAFAEFGKKTLLIDLDPSGDLTFRVGFENPRISIVDYFNGLSISDNSFEVTSERFNFIAADKRLAENLAQDALSKFLIDLPQIYDLVLLDLPSSISQPMAIGLTSADLILAPVRNDLHSLRGYLQVKAMAPNQSVLAVAIGANTLIPIEELLDETISHNLDVEKSAATKVSVLTYLRSGECAESYRSAGYSILEKLGLE